MLCSTCIQNTAHADSKALGDLSLHINGNTQGKQNSINTTLRNQALAQHHTEASVA